MKLLAVTRLSLVLILALHLMPVVATSADEACPPAPPELAAALAEPTDRSPADLPVAERFTADVIVIGGQSCTFNTSCDTSIVCSLPDGSTGNLSVTTRTCCPVCETLPCRLEPCTFDVVAVSCGCS